MRSIIKYFIQHPTIVNLCVLLILGLGGLKMMQTQITNFPKQSIRFISIAVPYPGASPSEVETGITIKIEENLEGIQGIDRVTSTSGESMASVLVELTEGADPNIILSEVTNAVDKINNFPDRVESPIIEKVEVKDVAISIGLKGTIPLSILKDYAKEIKDDLLSEPNISRVEIFGLPKEEIIVEVRENDLQKYQLTFREVANAIKGTNLESYGGEIKTSGQNISVKANNKKYFAKELQQIIVKSTPEGSLIRLQEVANIKDTFKEDAGGRYLNNERILTITSFTLSSEDIVDIANTTRKYMEGFNENHSNVELIVLEDGTLQVQERISSMMSNGLTGILLVLIVLALFLDRYLALWVAIKIPIAVIGMFLLADIQDMTINVVSLFGFVLVLGILVDDGVVIGENIYQWAKKKGISPQKAALEGTMEMLTPVLISLTTTAVAFSIFFFLPTQSGEFFSEMGFVVVAVLIVAMIESFFLLPAHLAHSKGLKAGHKPSFIERFFEKCLSFLTTRIYQPVYRTVSVGNRWVSALTILVFIGFLFGAISLMNSGKVGFTFFPNVDDDIIFTDLQMKPGTPISVTEENLKILEQAVWEVNEEYSKNRADNNQVIEHIEQITGPQPNQGKLKITFLSGEHRGVSSFELANAMREKTPPIANAENLLFGIGANMAIFGKPISFALYAKDISSIRAAKEELKSKLASHPDIKDVSDTDQVGAQEIELQLKPKAELLGLNMATIMGQVRGGFFGEEAQSLQRGSDEVKIWVRYPKEGRENINQLMNMRISDNKGNSYLLSDLAQPKYQTSTLAYNHLEGKREIRVEANVADIGVSAPNVITEIETDILPEILAAYPDISYSIEGQNRQSFKMGAAMGIVGPIIMLFIFALIILNFNSFSQAFIVFGLFPFVLIGVILGHWIQGIALNVFSLVGTIALIGIFVNNSLVFISSLNKRLEEGESWKSAIRETAATRFRPILLTTVTTVAGLAPLIVSAGLGAQFLKGPAIAIAYGLSFGLFNVLFLLPAILHVVNGFRLGLYHLFNKSKKEAAEVEPAVKSLAYLIEKEVPQL